MQTIEEIVKPETEPKPILDGTSIPPIIATGLNDYSFGDKDPNALPQKQESTKITRHDYKTTRFIAGLRNITGFCGIMTATFLAHDVNRYLFDNNILETGTYLTLGAFGGAIGVKLFNDYMGY